MVHVLYDDVLPRPRHRASPVFGRVRRPFKHTSLAIIGERGVQLRETTRIALDMAPKKEVLQKVYQIVPPMLESFHKGKFHLLSRISRLLQVLLQGQWLNYSE